MITAKDVNKAVITMIDYCRQQGDKFTCEGCALEPFCYQIVHEVRDGVYMGCIGCFNKTDFMPDKENSKLARAMAAAIMNRRD